MEWYLEVLKKYAVFAGRSRRKEYWMFCLFNLIVAVLLAIVDGAMNSPGVLGLLYSLFVLLPALAVTVRRLHDIDRSGWWIFISLIPVVGSIILLVFLVQDGQAGHNQYGANPKDLVA